MLGFVILQLANCQILYLDCDYLFMSWDSDDSNYTRINAFIDGYYFGLNMTESDHSIKTIDLSNDERFQKIENGLELPQIRLNFYNL